MKDRIELGFRGGVSGFACFIIEGSDEKELIAIMRMTATSEWCVLMNYIGGSRTYANFSEFQQEIARAENLAGGEAPMTVRAACQLCLWLEAGDYARDGAEEVFDRLSKWVKTAVTEKGWNYIWTEKSSASYEEG